MKMNKNKKTFGLAVLTLALALTVSVGSALAYFTTYTEVKGEVIMDLGYPKTEIEEFVVDGQKEITLLNTGEYDCYVRIKALTGDAYKENITYADLDGKWTPGADGYYYFSDIVPAGESTSQINVGFRFPVAEEGQEPPADFNIIIIQECTSVLFEEDGTPYADWDAVAEVTETVIK